MQVLHDMLNLHTVCQVKFNACRILKEEKAPFEGRGWDIFGVNIDNVSTAFLLIILLGCTYKMIKNTRRSYTMTGRAGLLTFFYTYMLAIWLELFITTNTLFFLGKYLGIVLVSIQLGLASSVIFCLLTASISAQSQKIGKSVLTGSFLIRTAVMIYATVLSLAIGSIFLLRNAVLFTVFYFSINTLLLSIYVIRWIWVFIRCESEIWAYGTLLLSGLFLFLGLIPLFTGSQLISIYSEKYLDGLFFMHLFFFCSVIMTHKLWLSLYDLEEECFLIRKDRVLGETYVY